MSRKGTPLPVDMTKDEEAYAWVVRLDSDQRTHQDEARFDQWLEEDDYNALRFEQGLELWNELGALRGNEEALEALGHLYDVEPLQDLEPEGRRLSRRAIMGGGLALAAALAGVLVVPRIMTSGPAAYQTLKGEQRRISLDDGSILVLDTATSVLVELKTDQRIVTLVTGQAFFNVASDPTRPFRVFAGADEIRALGTAFQVRFEGGAARVTLEEGRVAVFRGGAGKPLAALPAADPMNARNADIVLKPGEATQLAESKPLEVVPIDLSKTNAWRDGELVFDDVPLSEAVAEVNRYGGKTIVLDPSINELRISGTFHTNRPEAFVEGATAALPVRLRQSDQTTLVLTQI